MNGEGFLYQQQMHPKGSPLLKGLHPCLNPHFWPADEQSRRILTGAARRRSTPKAIAILNAELTPFDELAAQPWFRNAAPLALPRVADFLTLEELERVLKDRALEQAGAGLRDREYDEKFHLLQAPRLLIPDLAHYRSAGPCDPKPRSKSAENNPAAALHLERIATNDLESTRLPIVSL